MKIEFLARELKRGSIDEKGLNFEVLYLIAIARQYPELWREFNQLIDRVNLEAKK